jgi:hypothetical protein
MNAPKPASIVEPGVYLQPPQIATAYNIPWNDGAGVKIAILSLNGAPPLQSDLELTFADLKAAGLIPTQYSAPTINSFILPGGEGAGQLSENTLDVFCVATTVPAATINFYGSGNIFGSYLDLDTLIRKAVDDGNHIITLSFVFPEYVGYTIPPVTTPLESALAYASANKVAFCVGSGDWGSTFDNTGLQVIYPASSSHCIAVGGTKLILNPDNTRASETDFNIKFGNNGVGGGGGISDYIPRPVWQDGLSYTPITGNQIGSPTPLPRRGLPDISAPFNNYRFYFQGNPVTAAGTSASAPFIAGVLARMQNLTGVQRSSEEYNTIFYANPQAFYDITVGANNVLINDGYAGTAEWDPVTGLGPPIGDKLLTALWVPVPIYGPFQWITSSALTTATELVQTFTPVIASSTQTVSYSLISGTLPPGLSLASNGLISGIPKPVVNTIQSKFVIRATSGGKVLDRTFTMEVEGKDSPIWSTDSGYLPVGYKGEGFTFNHTYVKVNVRANSVDPSATPLFYYIEDNDGLLPPGLELKSNGELSGFVKANLPSGTVPELYTFSITATDGAGISDKRAFKILVVPSNFFRADNTYLNFSTTFVTSSTALSTIIAGTTAFSSSTSNINFTAIRPFDLLFVNNADIEIGFVVSTSTNSFTINTATTASIITGDILNIRRPGIEYEILGSGLLTTDYGYLLPPQFINGSDLGSIRANNNIDIPLTAYDPVSYFGPITYSAVTGTDVLNNLPENLKIDSGTGYAYGFIPYQPAYNKTYQFTVAATKTDILTGAQSTSTNTFKLVVMGSVDSEIKYVTDSNLGSIDTGVISDLSIVAENIGSNYTVKYQILTGSLPEGLTLLQDGAISGRAQYGSAGNYTFTVRAGDVYENGYVDKEFILTVAESTTQYTEIYTRPFLSREKRKTYQNFIEDQFIFDQKLIYRYFDPNFGVQRDLRLVLEHAIEKVNLSYYVSALRENFYRKRIYFGDVKLAVAKNTDNQVIYEIVYVDAVDTLVNNKNISVTDTFYQGREIYYPASIDNMRKQFSIIPLPDDTYISINENMQPAYMNTIQPDTNQIPGFIRSIPICYALPGQGSRIISRIKLSGFDFKQFDFEIDRVIVQSSQDNDSAKYLIFDRQDISSSIDADELLFGLDWAETPELTVRLDDESGNPINRE